MSPWTAMIDFRNVGVTTPVTGRVLLVVGRRKVDSGQGVDRAHCRGPIYIGGLEEFCGYGEEERMGLRELESGKGRLNNADCTLRADTATSDHHNAHDSATHPSIFIRQAKKARPVSRVGSKKNSCG
jgi:hypothetical protein